MPKDSSSFRVLNQQICLGLAFVVAARRVIILIIFSPRFFQVEKSRAMIMSGDSDAAWRNENIKRKPSEEFSGCALSLMRVRWQMIIEIIAAKRAEYHDANKSSRNGRFHSADRKEVGKEAKSRDIDAK